ncbi:type II toxin-antitoxin system HigA family antitoxin [Acaryochloris sp. CCMEE 5410]|uniref:helix-turn-helix domain-containing protein n=1 Tax=Acaryochloris sp. CCMEE 5410 TaxID=310037 RepID=UPI0002484B76|nr:transcriptional regulator [Acaryochloris sp. CCMEE 5410]KAI9134315.1 transcriptional regulator [Acaryochloris sp. CCMEE 5410]
MTLTFNADIYSQLLAEYRPKVITSEQENEAAISLAQKLEHLPNQTSEQEALLDLLVMLIEKYEDTAYPIPVSSPREVLLHLMEAKECIQEDLVGVIGSRGVVSEVVNGKRGISIAQAKSLADYFGVDAGLFI